MRHPVRSNKELRAQLNPIREGVAAEGFVSSPPGRKRFFIFGMALTLKNGCIIKLESFNRMAAEKSTVIGCGDSYAVRPQRRR